MAYAIFMARMPLVYLSIIMVIILSSWSMGSVPLREDK